MVPSLLSIAAGLLLLAAGAEGLVRGASSLARAAGVSPLVIGLTVVAVGTSLPELMVSVGAAVRGSGAVALGNVVGSNISNVALILGVSAMLRAMRVQAQIIRIDAPILLGASLALGALLVDGRLSRLDGGLLAGGIIAYTWFSVYAARSETAAVQQEYDRGVPQQHRLWIDLVLLAGGMGALGIGADLLVDGAVVVATAVGISEVVVGLTVVAIGTSLPEMATSVTAAYRGEGDIAVGNAVGSSIFNILGILGITVLIHPLATDALRTLDLAVMIGLAVALLPMMRSGFMLSRWEGSLLLLVYAAYLATLLV
jgi:cation:H+ antiporter